MKKIKFGKGFKISYFLFLGVLIVLAVIALFHVNSVLREYENEHPQRHLEKAVDLLIKEAEDGSLWNKDGVPSMEGGIFETSKDLRSDFTQKIKGKIKFSSPRWTDEDNCTYGIMSDGFTIGEITLRKNGPAVQKLAIISIQKYDLVSYRPISHTYTLKIPSDVVIGTDVFISVNGKKLEQKSGVEDDDSIVFTLTDLYSKPDISITDKFNNKAEYRLPDTPSGEISFDNCFYDLTLPFSLSVTVDGSAASFEKLEDGRYYYKIRLTKKANVEINDMFGNKILYQGNTSIPHTYYLIKTDKDCSVTVDGKEIPDSIKTPVDSFESNLLKPYVEDYPEIVDCEIVVLKENASVIVKDKNGKKIDLVKDKTVQDLSSVAQNKLDSVPESVSKEINVLKVLEDWSLFMTCDLDFASLSKYLIRSSDQYKEAYKYNNSIDRNQFISRHTFRNPPFVEENVSNFTWITDSCFSVDIHFVKRMVVAGKNIDDKMNERCYFIKYDDTKDNKDNPTWKLIGMKEIVNNADQ